MTNTTYIPRRMGGGQNPLIPDINNNNPSPTMKVGEF